MKIEFVNENKIKGEKSEAWAKRQFKKDNEKLFVVTWHNKFKYKGFTFYISTYINRDGEKFSYLCFDEYDPKEVEIANKMGDFWLSRSASNLTLKEQINYLIKKAKMDINLYLKNKELIDKEPDAL